MTDAPIPPHVKRSNVVESGDVDGVLWVTCRHPDPWWPSMNGYVFLSAGHPWRGLSDVDIHALDPSLDVHGGLTFSDGEWVGFDTAHLGDRWPVPDDTPEVVRLMFTDRFRDVFGDNYGIDWTPAKVADEARRLAHHVAAVMVA